MFETVNDPVDVIASFVGDQVRPVRFRWRGRAIAVREITGHWVRREGMAQLRYFSVQGPAADAYELCFDSRGTTWLLCKAWAGQAPA